MQMRPAPVSAAGPTLKVIAELLPVDTNGNGDIRDITDNVQRVLNKQGLMFGSVTIFVQGSTASVTTIEYEPGLEQDLPEAMERVAPSTGHTYNHDKKWHDGNGHSHVRASIMGPSMTVPFANGKLMLGTWQQIVLCDWDNRARHRDIVLQFTGVTAG